MSNESIFKLNFQKSENYNNSYQYLSRSTPSSSATFDINSIADTFFQLADKYSYYELYKQKIEKKIEPISKENLIENLSIEYKRKNLVFVFGSGVSTWQNIPDWDELLQKLLIKSLENDGKDPALSNIQAKLYLKQFSKNPLITAKYIRKHIGKGKLALERETQNQLYENIDRNISSLFREIIEFCKNSDSQKRLDGIISYNYDDLVEYFCSVENPPIKYNCRFSKKVSNLGSGIDIFHVHGFLPKEKKFLTSENKIILSEESYHEQYSDIYNWSNLVQIEKFMNKTCFLIGNSFKDPNLRRLLQIAYEQSGSNKTHYFIGVKNEKKIGEEIQNGLDTDKKLKMDKIQANINKDKLIEDLVDQILNFEVEDRDSFRIKTCWIDKWDELPSILKEIRTA